MQCRTCGTDIADKAIVCYRCGTATTDPVRSPAPVRARRGPQPSYPVALVPLVAAVILGLEAGSSAHPQAFTTGAEVSATLGALLLMARLLRRR
jgi:uncharacterized protein (TIGR03382 family)